MTELPLPKVVKLEYPVSTSNSAPSAVAVPFLYTVITLRVTLVPETSTTSRAPQSASLDPSTVSQKGGHVGRAVVVDLFIPGELADGHSGQVCCGTGPEDYRRKSYRD